MNQRKLYNRLSDLDTHIPRFNSIGMKTKAKLHRKGVKSPSTMGAILVKGKTTMVPKMMLDTVEEIEAWRNDMILKYNL